MRAVESEVWPGSWVKRLEPAQYFRSCEVKLQELTDWLLELRTQPEMHLPEASRTCSWKVLVIYPTVPGELIFAAGLENFEG